jgi:hypothetical protein
MSSGGTFGERYPDTPVRWFAWREVAAALTFGRDEGIALHYFRHDLRRFGLGERAPACHVLSADRPKLVAFVAPFGLPERVIQPPRERRPDVWHFDAFGVVLKRLISAYPLPEHIGTLLDAG